MNSETKLTIFRLVLTALVAVFIFHLNPVSDLGYLVFLAPIVFVTVYLWLGVGFFFFDMTWKLIAKPEERLFASIMLGSTVFVTVALLATYWLIKDSIGLGAAVLYAILAYGVFAIVRWFRRHTAAYYKALEAGKNTDDSLR